MQRLSVHYLPQFVPEHELADSTVVVIDQLRASTTVCYALAAGASGVVPLVEISGVASAAEGFARDEILLGGERGGERIEGFDLGNSPTEYTPDRVYGKRILFTTTNGTRAIDHARLARRVVMGCAANAAAVVEAVAHDDQIHLLCAGTGGHVTRDDQLAAGLLAHLLLEVAGDSVDCNDEAHSMRGEWHELATLARSSNRTLSDQLAIELRETQGGKNLLAIGHDDDLIVCGKIDACPVVPELDRDAGCLVL